MQVGDAVLTRDDGPQKIRWIGHATVRAVGDFAPIRIKAGALHNENDLLVSPITGFSSISVPMPWALAGKKSSCGRRHLLNGDTVVREDGGFVDYFQLLFDEHQIIYAEGIAAETMLVDTRTSPALPPELSQQMAQSLASHDTREHSRFEVSEKLLKHPGYGQALKRASTR